MPNDVGPGAPQALAQAFTAQTVPVTLSFTFSAADPGAGLGLQVYLGESAGGGQINLVIWDIGGSSAGDVSIFDLNTGSFQTILTDAVTFGATESFSLTINDYGASFDYDLAVGSKSTTGLSFSQNNVLDDFDKVSFVNEFGNTGYEIDNVAVVPEPSSAALLGLGGLALILRRRK